MSWSQVATPSMGEAEPKLPASVAVRRSFCGDAALTATEEFGGLT